VSRSAPAGDLCAGYEALRAQAVGNLPAGTPRGRALVLDHGLPDWIGAWAGAPSPRTAPAPAVDRQGATVGRCSEVVRLLTEMALGHQAALVGAS
jgi:hypothetical protein